MVPDKIEREVVIDAPVERVWRLVTEAEHLGRWFGDAGATVDSRAGGTLTVSWEEHGTVNALIERIEPPHVFAWRWARPVGSQPRAGNSTLVEFTLTPEGDSTRLTVVESGFRELEVPEQEQRDYAGENLEGWRMELGELREYAARVAA
jgi:uncharacterized protein YndB with AHSA1/START domain